MTTTPPRTRRPIRPQALPEFPEPTRPAQRAQAPKRRRFVPGTKGLVIGGLALAVLVAAGTVAVLTHPTMKTRGAALTADATPELRVDVLHAASLGADDVRATIDGTAIDPTEIDVDSRGRITIQAPRLDDGRHDVRVVAERAGLTRRTLTADWTLTVDTKAPPARITAPAPKPTDESAYVPAGTVVVTKQPFEVRVATEGDAVVRVTSDAAGAKAVEQTAAGVGARLQVTLPEGAQQLEVTSTDEAGNDTVRRQRVIVDTTGPKVTATVATLVKARSLELPIAASDPHGVELSLRINGVEVEDAFQEVTRTDPPGAGTTPDTAPTGDDEPAAAAEDGEDAAGDDRPAPVATRQRIQLEEGAFEGRNTLELTATDTLGSKTTVKRMFVLDSTEQLGDAAGLRVGARGADVTALHAALLEQQAATRTALLPDIRAKRFDAATRTAVQAYQRAEGLDADGVAGAETIARMTLRIEISLSRHQLTLYRSGEVVKTWGVAVGAPEYPTPTGEFEIQSMQKNPTWTPPDSDWAKDAEVIPPGPDNPLGTRWMAIHGTVGIHGTNNAASIGYSQSHGCIRMKIPDVEELFDMVAIGTKVNVVS